MLRRIGMTTERACLTFLAKDPACVSLASGQAGGLRADSLMISLQVFFAGNAQGVGFRWSVKHVAKGFDVVGWIRNLPDGRVELQASGEEEEVRAFLEAIGQSELRAHIRQQTEAVLPEPPRARGFEIRHE